jgi:exonuclease III
MLHNSKNSSRGVGILIASNLQYTVECEYRDNANNILAVKIAICGTQLLLISVYGPNNNNKSFFEFLRQILSVNIDIPKICAGDWNTTYCTSPGSENIDIINMTNPPSIIRSGWLADLYEEFHLSDPYRAIHYNKREFTYVPRGGGINRSRIDFFLISDSLLSMCNKCDVSQSLLSDLFDHKSIHLNFNTSKHIKNH